MSIINVLQKRYSTKEFESKELPEDLIDQLEEILILSPSSTNIQPWKFIVATSNEAKKRIAKSACGMYNFNENKILDASVVIVFSSLINFDEEYLLKVLEKEEADGRFPVSEYKETNHQGRMLFSKMHKDDLNDFQHWTEKQVYMNSGVFLLGVASLGLDAIAMEGIDLNMLSNEFNLTKQGYKATLVVSVGYAKDSDFNKSLPKSRLDKKDIIERK